jgi:hypothetical protein
MHVLPFDAAYINTNALMADLREIVARSGTVRQIFEDQFMVRRWPILALWVFREDSAYREVDDVLEKHGWARTELLHEEAEESRYTLPGVRYEEWEITPDLTKTEIWEDVEDLYGCPCDKCKGDEAEE